MPSGSRIGAERLPHGMVVGASTTSSGCSRANSASTAERLLFLSVDRYASIAKHDRILERCRAGDAEGAAEVEFLTWHDVPVGQR